MYFHDTFLVSAVAARCAAVAAGQFPVVLWHVLSQSPVGSNSSRAAAPTMGLVSCMLPGSLTEPAGLMGGLNRREALHIKCFN